MCMLRQRAKMLYADNAYYVNVWAGELIPAPAFVRYSQKATNIINAYTCGNIPADCVTDEVKRCCCELAELIYNNTKLLSDRAVSSEKVGDLSVTYESTDTVYVRQSKDIKKIIYEWLSNTGLLYRGVQV